MKTRRLFFALWPSAQVRQSIVETFSQFPRPIKGRIMQPHNLHMTLHFIGTVTEDIKDCMHEAARTISSDSFKCNLDCFACFSRAKIFWMGCQNTPVELKQLHNKLGVALENCGYRPEKRVFTPHVTLMRKAIKPVAPQPHFSIPWTVDEFVLLESIQDGSAVNYRVIEQYPLS